MQEEGSTQFTARYVYSFRDFKALAAAVRSRSRYGFWPLRLIWLAAALLIWGVPYLQAVLADDPSRAPLLPGMVIDMLPLFLLYVVWEVLLFRTPVMARLSYGQCSLANLEVTYRLGEKGVAWARENMQGEFGWPAIKAVIAAPDAAVLLIGKREGFVLPARAFASREEFDSAVSFARAKMRAGEDAKQV